MYYLHYQEKRIARVSKEGLSWDRIEQAFRRFMLSHSAKNGTPITKFGVGDLYEIYQDETNMGWFERSFEADFNSTLEEQFPFVCRDFKVVDYVQKINKMLCRGK